MIFCALLTTGPDSDAWEPRSVVALIQSLQTAPKSDAMPAVRKRFEALAICRDPERPRSSPRPHNPCETVCRGAAERPGERVRAPARHDRRRRTWLTRSPRPECRRVGTGRRPTPVREIATEE